MPMKPGDGFYVGPSMTSLDGGETWIPTWMLPVPATLQSFEVTAVDYERGVVTVSVHR